MTETTTNICIHMDSDLHTLDVSPSRPNVTTIAAMLEAERLVKDSSVKGYSNLDTLFADLAK